MTNINITIQGLEQLRDAFRKSPELVVSKLEEAVEKSAVILRNQAVREAPVNKGPNGGNLRGRITTTRVNRLTSEIIPKVHYANWVHEGTRPHIIEPRFRKALANKRTGQFFGKRVRHPGTRGNPFLLRAFRKTQSEMAAFFKKAVSDVFVQIKKTVI